MDMTVCRRRMALIVAFASALIAPFGAAHAVAPDRPGRHCYYPRFDGYSASTLREQRHRTRVCLIRFSYEIADGPSPRVDPGFWAADYCQAAYTYEEEKLSAAERRPLDLDTARIRAAAYARPWFAQAQALRCIPPSRR